MKLAGSPLPRLMTTFGMGSFITLTVALARAGTLNDDTGSRTTYSNDLFFYARFCKLG